MKLNVAGAGRTDPGSKRSKNEDAFLVDDELGLYVVCDGVTQKGSGDLASRRAIELVRATVASERATLEALVQSGREDAGAGLLQALEAAVQRACATLHEQGQGHPAGGMSTTLDCMLRIGHTAAIAHVGNGRAYLVRGGVGHRLTKDHTLLARQIEAGLISVEQAKELPLGRVLTRSLGSQASVAIDGLVIDLAADDALILCTDGLHDYLHDEQLAAFVSEQASGPTEDILDRLVRHANTAGGHDNIAVVVVRCGSTSADADSLGARARVEAVRAAPLLQALSYREQLQLVSVATRRHVAAGEHVVREGELDREMFVVVSGRLLVTKRGARIAELVAGGLVGEMAVVDYGPRSATVTALEASDVLVFSQDAMIGLMRRDTTLGMKLLWSMIQGLSAKLRASTGELASHSPLGQTLTWW